MPSSKEVLALRWAQKSDEEKNEVRKKNAERIRLLRAKKGNKKRSEMDAEELAKVRAKERFKKRQRRKNMTSDQREKIREQDRENTARKRRENKANKDKEEIDGKKKSYSQIDLMRFEKTKMKQLSKNCKTQSKLEAKRTEEERENIQAKKAENMREKRSNMTENGKLLARIRAKEGMREHRRFGFLREYKQRKVRASYNPWSWKKEPHVLSDYFDKVKEVETEKERKAELKRMNKMRVQRHRMKIKKMLQDPVVIEEYGEKGAYELLRERNIKELESLKKDSGLFD